MIMKTLYAFIFLNAYNYFSKSGRLRSVETAMYSLTFIFGHFLISLSVVTSKIFEFKTGVWIGFSLLLTFLFARLQARILTKEFLAKYNREFITLRQVSRFRNLLIVVSIPVLVIVMTLVLLIDM